MHRSLKVPEIVAMIAKCLSQPPDSVYTGVYYEDEQRDEQRDEQSDESEDNSYLYEEPCLDALWGCMPSARPLFNSVLLTSTEDGVMNLDRFNYYAPRVKGLKVKRGDIGIRFMRAHSIQFSTRAKYLLPNLRYLDWSDYDDTPLSHIPLLAGPKVTCLRMPITAWPKHCEQSLNFLFSSIREAYPRLEDVDVRLQRPRGDADWQLALLCSVFSTITSVKFSSKPSPNTLTRLSKMPNLRALEGRHSKARRDTASPLDFPSLQHLHWMVHSFNDAASFLRCLHSTGRPREYKTLTFEYDNCDLIPAELKPFLDTLLTTCSTQTLSSLTLQANGMATLEKLGKRTSVCGIASVHLRRLFQLSHIEVLRIGSLPIELDDAFIAAAATTWPRLRVLHLHSRVPFECMLTPMGLLPLARQCRQLEDLDVDIGSWPDPVPSLAHGSADTGRRGFPLSVSIRHSVFGDTGVDEDEVQRAARLQLMREIFPDAGIDYEFEKCIRW
ncbi:hypothetical protein EWM64_g1905 [Hericium alpestre]|uniref:F-box domain-containing protein n=1 Tax=Hericium alpestre TaxID=135208 RepID=A0A4Z0A5U9_9AGAM|nr:hypothetical protein EWM64_g1905 [Hericium alpestre]